MSLHSPLPTRMTFLVLTGAPWTHHIKRFNSRNQENSSLNQVLTDLFVVHGNGFGRDDPSQRCSVFFLHLKQCCSLKNCSAGSLLFHSSVWPRLKCKAQNAKSHLMLAPLIMLSRTNATYICKHLSIRGDRKQIGVKLLKKKKTLLWKVFPVKKTRYSWISTWLLGVLAWWWTWGDGPKLNVTSSGMFSAVVDARHSGKW